MNSAPLRFQPQYCSRKGLRHRRWGHRQSSLEEVAERLTARATANVDAGPATLAAAESGEAVLVRPRLGQGTFRVIVTDAYERKYQTVHIIGTRASGYPSRPGVSDSTKGRIHWRRPNSHPRFSLATLRRTIHSGKPFHIKSGIANN
jgi:hypothetical protein